MFPARKSSPWPFFSFFFERASCVSTAGGSQSPVFDHKQASHEQMCSEHPPTQLQKEGPWEGASSLVSTNSFHTDQWTVIEQKCLFILSSRGRALACDPSPPNWTRGEPRIYDKSLLSPLCFSLWHHTAWAIWLFQLVLKQVPSSIFTGMSQPCEFWCLLHMVWIVLHRQYEELSTQSPAPGGIW